jgi:replicative DNA helicase
MSDQKSLRKYGNNSVQKTKVLVRDINQSLGKLPPQAPDLEEAIIGAVLLEKNALDALVEFFKPEHFYVEANKLIYEAVIDLFNEAKPVDMMTVVDRLKKVGKLELVGGAYKIAELTSRVSSAANIEYHARVVQEFSIKRRMIEMASQIHHDAYDDTTDFSELLETAQKTFDAITGNSFKGNFKTAKQLHHEQSKEIAERIQKKGMIGIRSGLYALDEITNGFMPGELTVIAARPGMGKTAMVVCVARNIAIDQKKPVAIFSLEMVGGQLMNRLISAESHVSLERILRGQLSSAEIQHIGSTDRILSESPLFVDDNASLTILEFRARARRMVMQHGVQAIIVDYLQLMKNPEAFNRENEISSISQQLKVVAKELNIPVIALAQLSRAVETRGGSKRPQLSDLRESGGIEQDADVVMFLYRPEYYKVKAYEDGSSTQGVMEIIVAKHRNGRLDTAKVKYIGHFTKVTNFEITNPPVSNTPEMIEEVKKLHDTNKNDDDLPF